MTKRGLKEACSKSGHIKGKLVPWKRLSVGSQNQGLSFLSNVAQVSAVQLVSSQCACKTTTPIYCVDGKGYHV